MTQSKRDLITTQRQRQIIDAAFDVFSRKGFAEATTHEIAKEAGVAVGTIYKYFNNKRDLLVKVVTDTVITEPLIEILQKRDDVDDDTFIRSVISDRLNLGLENIGRIIPLLSEILRDDELSQRFADAVLKPNIGIVEKYLQAKADSGIIRPLNAQITIRCIIGMIIGFILIYRIEGRKSPANSIRRDELIDNMIEIILHGLQAEKT
ncbi:MAG: TetR/AcrR family transcriptional regulator [Dehalococcoidia bacterium]|jgi:AcrR family transcriptional regulator